MSGTDPGPRGRHGRLRRSERLLLRAAWLATGRRVLMTSVPKCGTHVLTRLLDVIALPIEREIIAETCETAGLLRAALAAARGAAVVGHLHGRADYWRIARGCGARVVFITRDPRDQVVSHVFHYRNHADHPLHPYFRDHVPDLGDAIMAGIRGFGPGPHGHLADVAAFYRYFTGWKAMEGVYHTTFERLVGPHGGGSAAVQHAEVRGILRHIGFPVPATLSAAAVARRVFDPYSPTFRAGQIGSWRRHFTPLHKDAFKEIGGQLLIDLGYERDLDW